MTIHIKHYDNHRKNVARKASIELGEVDIFFDASQSPKKTFEQNCKQF
jgi:hypothetical protein